MSNDEYYGSMFQSLMGGPFKYPNQPGFKKEGTSSLAASEVKSEAATLRQSVLEVLTEYPSTADEVASMLGRSVLSIRPRLSELVAMGKITETGQRHRNQSGKWANVYKITGGR